MVFTAMSAVIWKVGRKEEKRREEKRREEIVSRPGYRPRTQPARMPSWPTNIVFIVVLPAT